MGLWRSLKRALLGAAPKHPYQELRERHFDAARRLSRDQVVSQLEGFFLFCDERARGEREAFLALVRGASFDERSRAACLGLLGDAIRATGYLVRPGTVEDLWSFEGLLQRLVEIDRARVERE